MKYTTRYYDNNNDKSIMFVDLDNELDRLVQAVINSDEETAIDSIDTIKHLFNNREDRIEDSNGDFF